MIFKSLLAPLARGKRIQSSGLVFGDGWTLNEIAFQHTFLGKLASGPEVQAFASRETAISMTLIWHDDTSSLIVMSMSNVHRGDNEQVTRLILGDQSLVTNGETMTQL
jgi:hypothetical protein